MVPAGAMTVLAHLKKSFEGEPGSGSPQQLKKKGGASSDSAEGAGMGGGLQSLSQPSLGIRSRYDGGPEIEKQARRACAEAMRNLSKCPSSRKAMLEKDGVGVLQ